MSNVMLEVDCLDTARPSRPSLAQVKAIVEFIQKHPNLAHRKLRNGVARQKIKKLWIQISHIANSLEGTLKSTKGWIKFWSDKRRSIMLKQKHIEEGKVQGSLAPIEKKIYELCTTMPLNDKPKRKKGVKVEPYTDDEDEVSMNDLFPEEELQLNSTDNSGLMTSESDDRQLNIMEKLVGVMDQQAQALSQLAQASHNHSIALERLAEASHMQALAVDRLASTFENINASIHDVRNAIVSIDYTMKQCYSATSTQPRQNANLFS